MMTWTLDRIGQALRDQLQPSVVSVGHVPLGGVSTDTRPSPPATSSSRCAGSDSTVMISWPRRRRPGRRPSWSTMPRGWRGWEFRCSSSRHDTRAWRVRLMVARDLGRDRGGGGRLKRQDDDERAHPGRARRVTRGLCHDGKPQQPGRRAADAPANASTTSVAVVEVGTSVPGEVGILRRIVAPTSRS